jgi:hypothetical protein
VDDVINVAGHRLGTKELESASLIVLTAAPARARPAAAEPLGPACHRRAPDSRSRRIRLRWGRLTWSNWRRRRQHPARTCHYRRRGHRPP